MCLILMPAWLGLRNLGSALQTYCRLSRERRFGPMSNRNRVIAPL